MEEKEFKVAVTWTMSGKYKVKANSLKEAMNKVLDAEAPYDNLPRGDYVDDSMQIDLDTTNEINEEVDADEN